MALFSFVVAVTKPYGTSVKATMDALINPVFYSVCLSAPLVTVGL